MVPFQPVGGRLGLGPVLGMRVKPMPSPIFPAMPSRPREKTLGESFDELLGWSKLTGDILRTLGHGFGVWLGIHVFLYSKGFARVAGAAVGIGMLGAGICDVIAVGKTLYNAIAPTEGQVKAPNPTGQTTALVGPERRA